MPRVAHRARAAHAKPFLDALVLGLPDPLFLQDALALRFLFGACSLFFEALELCEALFLLHDSRAHGLVDAVHLRLEHRVGLRLRLPRLLDDTRHDVLRKVAATHDNFKNRGQLLPLVMRAVVALITAHIQKRRIDRIHVAIWTMRWSFRNDRSQLLNFKFLDACLDFKLLRWRRSMLESHISHYGCDSREPWSNWVSKRSLRTKLTHSSRHILNDEGRLRLSCGSAAHRACSV
mmetsp:Transcript_15589/g.39590  ORF Transcript_15589/g.39590 Transcript_15589/m.39590 type:complete len:234 (+) Transcript_15589:481-1182(+)